MTVEQLEKMVEISEKLSECLNELGVIAQQMDNNNTDAVLLKAKIARMCSESNQQMANMLDNAAKMMLKGII